MLWNRGNCLLATLKPSSNYFFHPSWCMFCLLAPEIFLRLIPWIDIVIIEMILSCSNLKKIDSSKLLPFLLLSCWMKFSKQDVETEMMIESMFLWNSTWIVKIVLACVPLSSYLTTWISGRDSCLVGVSCHIPSFWCCLVFASCLHHV